MKTFSEREGYDKPPEFMQLESMNTELTNLLANFCIDIIQEEIDDDLSFSRNNCEENSQMF